MTTGDPYEWLDDKAEVATSFSDTLLTQAFNEACVPDAQPLLAAELWLRRWLYPDTGCPPVISDTIAAARARHLPGFTPEFAAAVEATISPRRFPADPAPPIARHADNQEHRIWNLFLTRLRHFLEADGLLALVPKGPHKLGDGVAVPFHLEPGSRIVNARDAYLASWEGDLEQFSQSYLLGMRVRVLAVFPKDFPPDGGSVGFPFAIARERLAGRLPWFSPLELMASGAIASRMLANVEGVIAKQALAERMGCRFFAPEAPQNEGSVNVPAGTPLHAALSTIKDSISPIPHPPARPTDIVTRCRRELHLWKALGARPPISRLQEMERTLNDAQTSPAAATPSTPEASDARILLENLSASVNGSAFLNDLLEQETHVLQPYCKRPIHGRKLFVGDLDRFIQSRPGGLLPVTGNSGYGKTALLAHWLASSPSTAARFIHFFRADGDALRSLSRFFSRLAKFLENFIPETYQLGAPQGEIGEEAVRRLLRTYSYIPLQQRPPLVLVLDGIDEASQPYFRSFFPFPRGSWPENLHVVVSARTAGEPDCPQIQTWLDTATEKPLDLTSLDRDALVSWLRASPAPLPTLADESLFVDTLLDRAKGEGCALYIEYQLERLAKVPDLQTNWRLQLNDIDMPDGYVKLIALQLKNTFEKTEGTSREDLSLFKELLELLTAARGPLDETDLRTLLKTNLIPTFGELRRWVADSEGNAERGLLFRFNHQLIREALERAGLPLQTARSKLLQYCLRWKDHHSPYAIRHLIGHLKDAQPDGAIPEPHKTLFDIVASPDFLNAQAEAFREDPHAPLRTLQLALTLASDKNEVSQMARLGLAHALRVKETGRQSPLKALRNGHYDRATGLLAIYERREDRMLWYLLFAADLMLRSNTAQCAYILQEVLPAETGTKFRPEHSGTALALAFLLLTRLDAATPAGILNLFHADDQQRLCRLLSEAGAIEQALAVWPAIQSPTQADEAARHLAIAVARIEGRAAALPLLENIKDPYTQDLARADIADISAKAQDISGARQLLSEIAENHTLQRIATLCALAQSIHPDDATKPLKEAWRLVERLRRNPADQAIKAVALARIAIAELAAGYPNYSDKTFRDALDVAGTLPSVAARAKCLSDLAQAILDSPQQRSPLAKALREILQTLKRTLHQPSQGVAPTAHTTLSDDLLLRFAKQLSDAGDDDAAITISNRIRSNEQKTQALASIVANSHQEGQPISPRLVDRVHLLHVKSHHLHLHAEAVLKRSVTGNIKGLTDAIAHDLIHLAPRQGAAFWGPARVLGAIGVAASHHAHHDLARDAFAQARSLIEEITRRGDPWKTSWALVNLAEDQAEAKDLESASATLESARSAARQIHKKANQVRMLAEIAKTEAEALGPMAADKTFQAALDIVCGDGRKSQCDEIAGLGEILEAQSKVGLNQKAIATLDLAEALLRSIDPTIEQVWLAETTLAVSLVKSARYFPEFKAGAIRHAEESLRTYQRTRGVWERMGEELHPPTGFVHRVKAILAAYECRTADALECIRHIQNTNLRSTTARDVAVVFLDAGLPDAFDAALSLVTNRRSELLPDIAQEFTAKKDKDGLKRIFRDSVFFLDCTHRMLALLLKLYRPDPSALKQILALVAPNLSSRR